MAEAPTTTAAKFNWRERMPWGLLIVLTVYALLVVGYVWKTYWSSPSYQAAKAYVAAARLLGADDGRSCSEKDLVRAMELLIESGRLEPEDHSVAERVQRLRWRFDERKVKLSPELVRNAELISASARRAQEAKEGWLPIGAHDRGWAADQVLDGPRSAFLWSVPGFLFIIAFWGYARLSHRAARAKDKEAELKRLEREVEDLGAFRRVVPSGPTKTDEVAVAPVHDDAPLPRPPRPATGNRPALSRPGTGNRPALQRSGTTGTRPAVKKKPEDS